MFDTEFSIFQNPVYLTTSFIYFVFSYIGEDTVQYLYFKIVHWPTFDFWKSLFRDVFF